MVFLFQQEYNNWEILLFIWVEQSKLCLELKAEEVSEIPILIIYIMIIGAGRMKMTDPKASKKLRMAVIGNQLINKEKCFR